MSLKIKFAMCILLFFCLFSYAEDNASKSSYKQHIKELVEKYPIKPHHAKFYFDCMHCHTNQGDNPEKFKNPGDKGCLSCHKSKEHMAQRTKFMDTLKANPHNSVHDGPNLYCDECHMEHKKSVNMCDECHEAEVKHWMKVTP
ncbi:cytochrome c3 family protein [Campylobacter sputorum]|uniref:cytochrome c3 family protein n=1 Tax=Campylobacter sputorum TaxID=206 RepID=UPI000B779A7F|nr:cytochrome c3 family protein [Campylobacter sputorum]ASM37254.1 cytochrome c3 [Campylobacter sputorum bv. faecalis CCUG 20703]